MGRSNGAAVIWLLKLDGAVGQGHTVELKEEVGMRFFISSCPKCWLLKTSAE
jgi:hypothetical protein